MYEKPNHTQIPNLFLDRHLPEIKSLAELKITLVVLRNTIGWHEKEADMDIPKLMRQTGLTRQSVVDGVTMALNRETIKRRRVGHGFFYEANIVTVKKVDSLRVKNFARKVDSSEDESLYVLKKEKKPPQRGKSYKPPAEPIAEIATYQSLLDFLAKISGPLSVSPKEKNAAKRLIATYDVDQCKRCQLYLVTQPWRSSAVTWTTVEREIDTWIKDGEPAVYERQNGHPNGNGNSLSGMPKCDPDKPWFMAGQRK